MNDPLLYRFLQLWENIRASGNPYKIYYKLRRQYLHPRRFYHTFDGHIGHCLQELDAAQQFTQHSDGAVAAIFYHDANMSDPDHKSNELWSAIYAHGDFRRAGCPKKFCHLLFNNILATRHLYGVAWNDGKVVMDTDLSILGQMPTIFDEYERSIGQEYANIPGDQYRIGRIKFLQGLLHNYTIYQTPFFREKYENQARENIRRSLATLQAT